MNKDLQKTISTAYKFSLVIEGAHILYNVLLLENFKENKIYSEWETWKETMQVFDWESFDTEYMWALCKEVKVPKLFVNQWIGMLKANKYEIDELKDIIIKQEKKNKGNRAKLKDYYNDNFAPENTQRIGLAQLEFRFHKAKMIINDFQNPKKN